MKWYLIVKEGEARLVRCTSTALSNDERHGWRALASWKLEPTSRKVQETLWYDKWAREAQS